MAEQDSIEIRKSDVTAVFPQTRRSRDLRLWETGDLNPDGLAPTRT